MPKLKLQNNIKILVAVLLLGFVVSKIGYAQGINIEQLRKAAEKYTGGSSNYDDIPSEIQSKIPKNVKKPQKPKGPKPEERFIEPLEPELSDSDKRFVTMHMKLANRYFSRKDYEKAQNEIKSVLGCQPSHGGAHFMKAVISARKKLYDEAWYYILIAKDKDTNKPKVTSFINKLSTVSKEPVSPSWVKGIYRGIPASACDKCCDIIEKFLKSKISQYVSSITIDDFTNSSSAKIPININFEPSAPTSSELRQAFQADSNVKITNDKLEFTKWSATFEITDLPIENKKAVPIKDLKDFIEGINEEVDVAINETDEYEVSKDGTLQVDYKISVRNFSDLNKFLRIISPYVKKYRISSITLGGIPGSIILKTEVTVFYCVK